MSFTVVDARQLAAAPLDAAAQFGRDRLAMTRAATDDVIVLFATADHTHASWRKAMIEELAREAAPRRVNGVVAGSGANGQTGANEVMDYLARAPGVTGQVLEVAGSNA